MDTRSENFRRARQYAGAVYTVKKGHFMDAVQQNAVRIDAQSYVPHISEWCHLCEFRTGLNEETTVDLLKTAVASWVRSTTAYGRSAVFALTSHNRRLDVMYGSGAGSFERIFGAGVPECRVSKGSWSNTRYQYNGIITGSVGASNVADVFASSKLDNSYASCIIVPLADEEVRSKIEENRSLLTFLENYKSFQRVYGSSSRRVEEVPLPEVVRAIELLKEENKYLEDNIENGFVRSAVRFGAQTERDYRTLATLLKSCAEGGNAGVEGYEPVRIFEVQDACYTLEDCLAIPSISNMNIDFSDRVYLITMQTVSDAASFCVPPVNSYNGYYLKNYSISEESRDIFPLVKPVEAESVDIGHIADYSIPAAIPLSAMHSHTFVTGATETGKTTTVKKILTELDAKGIPFVVIEAAKKEYISLLGSVPSLKIYTPGADGIALQFNPLQPEEGVLIENHVAAVVRALVAATGGEHPIPEAYDGLLKQTYSEYGWEYGMLAYHDEKRPFPTFEAVLENVDSYIDKHARYGPEVKQNLTAALKLRSENMHSGAIGRLFYKPYGLKAKDFLETPCVIELADFSTESASFIMNILLFRLQSYLSRLPECRELKRVIVIEEAHNIFKKTISEDSGRARNNEYLEKMLAEVRSSGTGLILSDQRPGIMSDAVIANTSVKIIHALTDTSDRETVGLPANMTEIQLKKLSEFKTGECVISIRGHHGVQHTLVEPHKEERTLNCACHICTCSFRCRREAVKSILENINPDAVRYHISKIQANPYNIPLLEENISKMLLDLSINSTDATKVCLLGEILTEYGSSSYQENRIITTSYSNYLKRRNSNE